MKRIVSIVCVMCACLTSFAQGGISPQMLKQIQQSQKQTAADRAIGNAIAATALVLICLEGSNFLHHRVFKSQKREYDVDEKNE